MTFISVGIKTQSFFCTPMQATPLNQGSELDDYSSLKLIPSPRATGCTSTRTYAIFRLTGISLNPLPTVASHTIPSQPCTSRVHQRTLTSNSSPGGPCHNGGLPHVSSSNIFTSLAARQPTWPNPHSIYPAGQCLMTWPRRPDLVPHVNRHSLQPAHTENMNHPPAHRTQPSSQTDGQQSAGTTTNNKTFKVMRRRRRYTSFLQYLNPSPRRETADRRPQKGAQDLTGAI